MRIKYHIILIISIILSFQSSLYAQKVIYPKTKTVNVVDYYHGRGIFDPYRWLENIDSAEVKSWAVEENNLTRSYLDSIPYRSAILERLRQLENTPENIMPIKKGDRYFYFLRPRGLEQYVLMRKENLDSIGYWLVDPNYINDNSTVAITASAISPDGQFVAYAYSYGGSDWQEIHFCQVCPREDYNEILNGCKFVNMAWSPNDSGIYYTRWPNPDSVKPEDEYNDQKIYWHQLGTPQSADSIIFEMHGNNEIRFSLFITTDDKYLIVAAYSSSEHTIDYYYKELDNQSGFIKFIDQESVNFNYIGNEGKIFYFNIKAESSGGKVLALDLSKPDKNNRTEIISSDKVVIDYVVMVNHCFVVAAIESGYHRLMLYSLEGKFIKDITLPAMGTVFELEGDPQDSIIFIGFESFVCPPMTYMYNFISGEFRPFSGQNPYCDLSHFVTRQIAYKSDGGVEVPMYLTYDIDLPRDGNNPTILYGYGGFGISMTPHFSSSNVLWLENGGVYAVADIRGGGEFGYNWHWAGWGPYKQTSFNDFKNAAKWLIKNKITKSSKLAIMGGSMAAC